MKIEYIPEGSSDCLLLRLYDSKQSEVETLAKVIDELSSGHKCAVSLLEISGFQGVNVRPCRLDAGRGRSTFVVSDDGCVWTESPERWRQVRDLLDPFLQRRMGGHFQWLHDETTKVLFSASPDGCW